MFDIHKHVGVYYTKIKTTHFLNGSLFKTLKNSSVMVLIFNDAAFALFVFLLLPLRFKFVFFFFYHLFSCFFNAR